MTTKAEVWADALREQHANLCVHDQERMAIIFELLNICCDPDAVMVYLHANFTGAFEVAAEESKGDC